MYPEFIAIYVGLLIVILMLAAVLVLLIKLVKNQGGSSASAPVKHRAAPQAGGVVFCKNCATQFNASLRNCPKCGMPR